MSDDKQRLPVRITLWVLESIGVIGLFVFFGFVIDVAFQELLGVEKASYFSTLHLGRLAGEMVVASVKAVFGWMLAHWLAFAIILAALFLTGWLSTRVIVKRDALKTRGYLFPTLFIVLAIGTAIDIVFFDVPYMFFDNLIGVRVRADRAFPEAGILVHRTADLWQAFVCAHRPPQTPLAGCTAEPGIYSETLRDDFAGNIALALGLVLSTAALGFAHHKIRPPVPWPAYALLGLGLLFNITGLFYQYGKAFQPFTYDRTQMSDGKNYYVGLVLSEDESNVIVYDEAEGYVIERTITGERKRLGTADLIRTSIELTNRPRPPAVPDAREQKTQQDKPSVTPPSVTTVGTDTSNTTQTSATADTATTTANTTSTTTTTTTSVPPTTTQEKPQ